MNACRLNNDQLLREVPSASSRALCWEYSLLTSLTFPSLLCLIFN